LPFIKHMHYNAIRKKLNERLGGISMDFANRGNRPMQQQPAPQTSNEVPLMPQKSNSGKVKSGFEFSKLSALFVLFGTAIVIAVLIVGLVFGGGDTTNKEKELILSDKYQAVFLDSQDGQVYFGKLNIYNRDMYVLTDIYYVRVENPVQPEGAGQNQQSNISLAKLGNELHGPEDEMYISRDKVLFWENLKDDGQVVEAITKYKADGGNTENTTNTPDTTKTDQTGSETETTPQAP